MNILDLLKKKQAVPAPMQYNPGAMRQFTPSPAPDMPFMPAPQVGPQSIPTGFPGQGGPQNGMWNMPQPHGGGLAGFGGIPGMGGFPGGQQGGPNIGPGMPPQMAGGPNIGPGMPGGPQLPPAPQVPTGADVAGALAGKNGPLGQAMGGRQLNPQMAQYAMSLLQRSRSAPIQFQPMSPFRGGR